MRTLAGFVALLSVVAMPLPTQTQAPAALPAAAPAPLEPNPAAPLYRHTGEQFRVYNFPGPASRFRIACSCPTWTPRAVTDAGDVARRHERGRSIPSTQQPRLGSRAARLCGRHADGYRPLRQPYYGSRYRIARADAAEPAAGWTAEEDARAEQDVLNVIELVTKEYNVDTSRIYLHGQNPSGSGALHLAAKYPDRFKALIISSGPIEFGAYPWARMKGKGLLVIHGDQDTVNPIAASQRMAEAARAAGVNATYATVPGGTHLEAYLTYARGSSISSTRSAERTSLLPRSRDPGESSHSLLLLCRPFWRSAGR